jgi:hypothetical protein
VLIDNGQAAWVFGDTPEGAHEHHVSSIAALRHGPAYLSFASTNTTMRGTQAMLAVDHVFRLMCMPETCTKHRPHEVIQSRGVTHDDRFSRAVRVMDAAYLELPYTAWTPTEGFGNTSEQYVAVLAKDAKLYCSRLRTGGHSDWRLPNADELARINWPKSLQMNKLWLNFGWPTGPLAYQSSLYRQLDTGLHFHGTMLPWGPDPWRHVDIPHPVSCIR